MSKRSRTCRKIWDKPRQCKFPKKDLTSQDSWKQSVLGSFVACLLTFPRTVNPLVPKKIRDKSGKVNFQRKILPMSFPGNREISGCKSKKKLPWEFFLLFSHGSFFSCFPIGVFFTFPPANFFFGGKTGKMQEFTRWEKSLSVLQMAL